jgi:hypothetical protein
VNPPEIPRKNSRLWIILGVVLFTLVIAGGVSVYFGGKFLVKTIEAQKNRRASLAELEAKRREFAESARASAEEGKVEGASERLSKFGESVGNAAESTTGTERQGLRVAQRLLQSMAPAVSTYEAAFKELQSADVLKVDLIDSKEAIASRVVVVNKFSEANDNLLRVINGLESQVRVELEKEGFPQREREKFISSFLGSANVELTRKIRQCDTELVTTLLKMLAILDREWGAWKVENGNVSFNRAPAIEEYNTLVGNLDEIGERQSTAQQELLKRTGKQTPLR